MLPLLLLLLCYTIPVLGLWHQPVEFGEPEYPAEGPKEHEQFCFDEDIEADDIESVWDKRIQNFLDNQKKEKHNAEKKRSIAAKKKAELEKKK